MASIAEWIEKIKTAIYGEEVRGAIWQSLDAMNTQVDAINVDSAQIKTNKQNIATNTAAITALNSSMYRNTGNHSTYSIPIPRKPNNGYYTIIVYGGTGSETANGFLILVFIDLDSANRAVVFPVLSHGNITFTASWDASLKTLTLNASSTVYGGISAIVF